MPNTVAFESPPNPPSRPPPLPPLGAPAPPAPPLPAAAGFARADADSEKGRDLAEDAADVGRRPDVETGAGGGSDLLEHLAIGVAAVADGEHRDGARLAAGVDPGQQVGQLEAAVGVLAVGEHDDRRDASRLFPDQLPLHAVGFGDGVVEGGAAGGEDAAEDGAR